MQSITRSTSKLSTLDKTFAIGIGALIVLNITSGIIALIAHLILLIVLQRLTNRVGGCLKFALFPIFAVAWLYWFLCALWVLTIGMIF